MTTNENTLGWRLARRRAPTAGAGLTERTSDIAGDIAQAVAATVEAVLGDTLAALPQITQTRFVFEIARDGKNRRIWPLGRPASAEPATVPSA
ncbi:hypothetical protein BH10ACT9_BH10ACT9_39390 [soil metagenome]|jgi:hypothetical protein|uniref:Uncharacterized protein n=1 Tax=Mycolicibacterium hippocampi TaxID=659824 RepID=A0A850PQM3_9MYCO|nr:hypothetical protein [Mycolicibacterium hippocampi]